MPKKEMNFDNLIQRKNYRSIVSLLLHFQKTKENEKIIHHGLTHGQILSALKPKTSSKAKKFWEGKKSYITGETLNELKKPRKGKGATGVKLVLNPSIKECIKSPKMLNDYLIILRDRQIVKPIGSKHHYRYRLSNRFVFSKQLEEFPEEMFTDDLCEKLEKILFYGLQQYLLKEIKTEGII